MMMDEFFQHRVRHHYQHRFDSIDRIVVVVMVMMVVVVVVVELIRWFFSLDLVLLYDQIE